MSILSDARIVQCLQKAWTSVPSSFHVYSPIAAQLLPVAIRGGVVPLVADGMQRLNNVPLKIRNHYQSIARQQAMQTALNQWRVAQVFQCLRAAGLEPILLKGWSVARHYAHPARRSQMDIDICVPAPDVAHATDLIAKLGFPPGTVDLHGGLDDLADRPWAEIFSRTHLVALHDCPIRLLSEEDQLRLVCLHFWRHRCNRPVWLCDVGALIENAKPDFDWELCFAGSHAKAEKVRATIAMAIRLLGANLDAPWVAPAVAQLPTWLTDAVLNRWDESGDPTQFTPWEAFNPLDPIRTVNQLGIGPYQSERLIKSLTHLLFPFVWGVRTARNVSRSWSAPADYSGGVVLHRKVVT